MCYIYGNEPILNFCMLKVTGVNLNNRLMNRSQIWPSSINTVNIPSGAAQCQLSSHQRLRDGDKMCKTLSTPPT